MPSYQIDGITHVTADSVEQAAICYTQLAFSSDKECFICKVEDADFTITHNNISHHFNIDEKGE